MEILFEQIQTLLIEASNKSQIYLSRFNPRKQNIASSSVVET